MQAQTQIKSQIKKYKLTLYLEEPYEYMLEEIKKWRPQLSKNDIIRIAIQKLYFAMKAVREGRDPCEEFLIM